MEIFGYSMAYLMNEDYFQLEMMFTTVMVVLDVNKMMVITISWQMFAKRERKRQTAMRWPFSAPRRLLAVRMVAITAKSGLACGWSCLCRWWRQERKLWSNGKIGRVGIVLHVLGYLARKECGHLTASD